MGPTLYFFIVAVCAFFAILVIALIVVFMVKYRRRSPKAADAGIHGSLYLELAWTLIPFVLAIAMFGWSAAMFFKLITAPASTTPRSGRMSFLIDPAGTAPRDTHYLRRSPI